MGAELICTEELDKRVTRFIAKHHVLTLATSEDNKPYCCSCFYVYSEKTNTFIVTSDDNTRHISEVLKQPFVAGCIALETTMVGKIQGVQFTGIMKEVKAEEFHRAKVTYIKRFPIAAFADLQLWNIEPDFMKYTDNRLGFGKKMIWNKQRKES